VSKQHQKHVKLAKPSGGAWGRAELALLGAPCEVIREVAQKVAAHFEGEWQIGFADANHHPAETASGAAALHLTDHGNWQQVDIAANKTNYNRRTLFNACDLVLVNGNHFDAQQQVLFIHPAKSMTSKLEELTDVKLIVLTEEGLAVPDYLQALAQTVPTIELENDAAIIDFFESYLRGRVPLLNGLVLVGGNSTRMGTDKSSLVYHDKKQRDYVYELLQPLCDEVFISCNARQSTDISLPRIEDRFLGIGPMGGILSAFQFAPDRAWLTLACDMPHLTQQTFNYLIQQRKPSKLATAFVNTELGFPEPLLTIWEPRAYPVLLEALSLGSSCPRKVLINSDIALLSPPDRLALVNVNDLVARQQACALINQNITA
jgi:molybdopterin-guanine dinucleotide biosynthesis protein A